jgi:flagellar basal-body rod protein FlgB
VQSPKLPKQTRFLCSFIAGRSFHNCCTPKPLLRGSGAPSKPQQNAHIKTVTAKGSAMINKLTGQLEFQGNALLLRAERQRTIASNIANADTPGYVGRDFDFASALQESLRSGKVLGQQSPVPKAPVHHSAHVALPTVQIGQTRIGPDPTALGYTVQTQPSVDNNTVDLDRERANFVDNSVRYEATLRFINGSSKTLLSAIQGQ